MSSPVVSSPWTPLLALTLFTVCCSHHTHSDGIGTQEKVLKERLRCHARHACVPYPGTRKCRHCDNFHLWHLISAASEGANPAHFGCWQALVCVFPFQCLGGSDKRFKCPKFGPIFIKLATPHLHFSAAMQSSFCQLNTIFEAYHVHREARANALALPLLLELEDAGLLIPPGGKSPDSVVPPTPSPPSTLTPAPRYALHKSAK
jgi:hypothetical protein